MSEEGEKLDAELEKVDLDDPVIKMIDEGTSVASSIVKTFAKPFAVLNPLTYLDTVHKGVSMGVKGIDKISKFLTGKEIINNAMDGDRDEYFGGQSFVETALKPVFNQYRAFKRAESMDWQKEYGNLASKWKTTHNVKEIPKYINNRIKKYVDDKLKEEKVKKAKGLKKLWVRMFG